MSTGIAWTVERIAALPVVIDLETAASIYNIGRTTAYALAKAGDFPVDVIRVGAQYRVPTARLQQALGLAATSDDDRAAAVPGPRAAADQEECSS